MKNSWIKKCLLILLVFWIFSSFVFADDLGCCANPGVTIFGDEQSGYGPERYCAEGESTSLTLEECCPVDGGYDDSDPFLPDDQTDCENHYFQLTTCTGLTYCEPGCCHDPTNDECAAETIYGCTENGGQWVTGFPLEQRLIDTNPCYQDFIVAGSYNQSFPECPIKDACTESGYSMNECRNNPDCFWCPETGPSSGNGECFTTCSGKCGGYPVDVDPEDGECDPEAVEYGACESEICEASVTETCACGTELAEPGGDEFCCAIRETTFSDQTDCTNFCYPDCVVGKTLSFTKGAFPDYNSCYCGQEIPPLTGTGLDAHWCCEVEVAGETELKVLDRECGERAEVSGVVFDGSADPLGGVEVRIGTQTVITEADGIFSFTEVQTGTQTLVASKQGYVDYVEEIELAEEDVVYREIYLEEDVSNCGIQGFTATCDPDDKQIELEWGEPCPDKNPEYHLIKGTQEMTVTEKQSYNDTEILWESSIEYTLRVVYPGLGTFEQTLDPIVTGPVECADMEDYCENNIKHNCTGCFAADEEPCEDGTICTGPNQNGELFCKIPEACNTTGNPFGVFYQNTTCLGNLQGVTGFSTYENYCTYDYSSTTVDECKTCGEVATCFDYEGHQACTTDNCLASHGSSCEYIFPDKVSSETGRGICYEEGYEGTEFCQMCNSYECDAADCNKLGACVWNELGCRACDDEVSCETYSNQQSCEGGQPYQVDDDSTCSALVNVNLSNDKCGIGKCEWFGDYCGYSDGKGNEVTTSVSEMPETTIDMESGVQTPESHIKFETDPNNAETYFCFDQSGECCPEEHYQKSVSAGLSLNHPDLVDGQNYIVYYSIDAGTKEPVEVKGFVYDGTPPIIQIDYVRTNSTTDDYESDVRIDVELNEPANCTAQLLDVDSENFNYGGFDTYFTRNYPGLTDGNYRFRINCTDVHDLTSRAEMLIEVDRIDQIFDENPLGDIFSTGNVEISWRTKGQATCNYAYGSTSGTLEGAQAGAGEDGVPFVHYNYAASVSETTGEPNYHIYCEGNGWTDQTDILFKVDTRGPETTIYSDGAEWDDEWRTDELTVSFECEDSPYFGFGCDYTEYCLGDQCTPNIELPVGAGGFELNTYTGLCYRSVDNAGNMEDTRCVEVKIDNIAPQIHTVDDSSRLDDPAVTYETHRLRLKVAGSDGQSGLNDIVYRLLDSDDITIIQWTSTKTYDEYFYVTHDNSNWLLSDGEEIVLENGETYYFEAQARDNANKKSSVLRSDGITIDFNSMPDHCFNTVVDGDETGRNCGGSCPQCKGDEGYCGDGIAQVDEGEECDWNSTLTRDGPDLNNKNCSDWEAYYWGHLRCNPVCKYDDDLCVGEEEKCGDGVVNQDWEVCDKSSTGVIDFDGAEQNCQQHGYGHGDVGCTDCELDFTECSGFSWCGDGNIDDPNEAGVTEKCDCGPDGICTPDELDGMSCGSFAGFLPTGELGCIQHGELACQDYDRSGCHAIPSCGDGYIDATSETCEFEEDGSIIFAGDIVDCTSSPLDFESGELGCNPDDCSINKSQCVARSVCSDGNIDTPNFAGYNEQCDCGLDGVCTPDELGGETCESLNMGTGDLGCHPYCGYDYSNCSDAEDNVCGDGDADPLAEECDGSDLAGRDCSYWNCEGGDLGCFGAGTTDECTFNVDGTCSTCFGQRCQDGVKQVEEECDKDDFGGQECDDFGDPGTYTGGDLDCTTDCLVDVTGCTGPNPPQCNDGVVNQDNEICDKLDLQGWTCEDLGYESGTLGCNQRCDDWDRTRCSLGTCGDGHIDEDEDCDCGEDGVCTTAELGESNCYRQGFTAGGSLGCKADCSYDTSECIEDSAAFCGDGERNQPSEQCDGNDFLVSTNSCSHYGYNSGTLYCNQDCSVNITDCSNPMSEFCGDGSIQDPNSGGFHEECDGTNLDQKECSDVGNYEGGELKCIACSFFEDDCVETVPEPICGDSIVNQYTEECDKTDFGGVTCEWLGCEGGGDLICNDNCTIDMSDCAGCGEDYCGNNEIEDGEECDGTALAGKNCTNFDNYTTGELSCRLCRFTFQECGPNPPECGDGLVNQMWEWCDGDDIDQTCKGLGFISGELKCKDTCDDYIYNDCRVREVCGDGILNRDAEECDENDFGGKTCTDFDNYTDEYDLDCKSNCELDTSVCTLEPVCGDDDVNQGFEVCDGTDLDGHTCVSLGYSSGDLACTENCSMDYSGCVAGNGTHCLLDSDCLSLFCHPEDHICLEPSCSDNYLNGNETDVDCGGDCIGCGQGEGCIEDSDCISGICDQYSGECQVQTDHCKNGVFDEAKETDVDCGGMCSKKCKVDENCEIDSDCLSGMCDDDVCVSASCNDNVKNGHESDVDCGGTCPGCQEGAHCWLNSDCLSKNCESNICQEGQADADQDGIPDSWEDQFCNGDCDPDADDDGDGYTNYEEYQMGTDPFQPNEQGRSSRWLLWVIIVVILLGLGGGGYYYYQTQMQSKPEEHKPVHTQIQRPTMQPKQTFKPSFKPKTTQPPIKVEKRKFKKQKQRKDVFDAFSSDKKPKKTAEKTKPKQPKKPKLDKDVWKDLSDIAEGELENKDNFEELEDITKELHEEVKPESEKIKDLEPKESKGKSKVSKLSEKSDLPKSNADFKPGKTYSELKNLYGKRLTDDQKRTIHDLVLFEVITPKKLAENFVKLKQEDKFSMSVLKQVMHSLQKQEKAKIPEIRRMLTELAEKEVIEYKDISDIIYYIQKK